MKTLVLIDGHSLAYRMYFALERTQMKTSRQFPTWGVYGFFKALFDLLKQVELDGMAVAFDMGRVTFRTEMYADYKAHRKAMPDSLAEQMGKIREGIDLLGIPIFEVPNYEADDLIGTLARQAAAQGVEVLILTGDQDAFQIIDDETRISVLLPSSQGGVVRYDREKVYEKLGIYPGQLTDFKGLKGDSSDNIPGVPGIGDKTAAKLLLEYGNLENVLAHAAEISGNKLRESLITYKDQALLSKDLATIRYDAPVTFSEKACHLRIPDINDFMQFLADLEFRSFLAQSQTLLQPFLNHLTPQERLVALDTEPSQLSLADTLTGETETDESVLGEAFKQETLTALMDYYAVPHRIVTQTRDLMDFIEKIQTTGVFALDIETSGLDVMTNTFAGISLSWCPDFEVIRVKPRNPLGLQDYPQTIPVLEVKDSFQASRIETIYIPLAHPDCSPCLSTPEVLHLLKPLLEDSHGAIIAHNAKFELNVFRRHGVYLQGLLFDTMIASYVDNPDRRHGLKALVHDILGHTMQDITELIGKGKKQIAFTEVPVKAAAAYGTCDAHVTMELAHVFNNRLGEAQASLLYEVELPLVPVLAEMEYNGVSLDTEYLAHLSEDLEARLKVVEQEIYAMAGVTFNLNSPKQVGDVLFGKLQIPAKGLTPTKSGFTTNAKVIESLAPHYPIVQKLLDYRQLFKLKSTYIDTLPLLISPVDNRLHTSFNQTIASTGRLSSSEPNLQNIPIRSELGRSIRQGFVPANRTDWLMLSADYSQIELRLLAHFSEDPKLIDAFRKGLDIHQATAALVYDVSLDQVTKEMRYKAKAVNFGIIYGQTAFGLSNALKITPKEAAAFIDKYFAQYPHVKAYIERTKAEAKKTGKVSTLCGRLRDFSDGFASPIKNIREFTERAAFNMPLQGSAADLMKAAMIRLFHALKREGCQSKLILQVHDELVLEVFRPERDAVKQLVLWAMTLEQPLRVPLEVDVSEGPTWMEVE